MGGERLLHFHGLEDDDEVSEGNDVALGHLDLARLHLEKSIAMDKKMRDLAKCDPDLAALRE